MSALLTSPRKQLKSWLIDRMFSVPGSDYQRLRHPKAKFDLITSRLELSAVGSVFEVGCNEGFILAEFAKLGKFAVGVDTGPYFLNHYLNDLDNIYGRQSAAFGVFPLTPDNASSVPDFDLVLLLSVHHQWIIKYGDDYARDLVTRLIVKSRRYFVIEFAATAKKYGFTKPMFTDNDEDSVRKYAEDWLRGLAIDGSVAYIGKNREGSSKEPYRYLYIITKNPS